MCREFSRVHTVFHDESDAPAPAHSSDSGSGNESTMCAYNFPLLFDAHIESNPWFTTCDRGERRDGGPR